MLQFNKPWCAEKPERKAAIGRRPRKVNRSTGQSISHSIHVYELWYRYVRLALEMESLGIKIEKGGRQFPVKIDRAKYEGWDLDEMLNSRFNDRDEDWWKRHSWLFSEEQTAEITSPEEVTDTDRYRYLQINREKKLSEVVREVKYLLADQVSGHKNSEGKTALYQTTREVRYYGYRNAYSALVLKINGEGNRAIANFLMLNDAEPAKAKRKRKSNAPWLIKPAKDGLLYEPNKPKIRDTLDLAKRAILSVADGYFPKHPRKKYF